jgi:hypothetical protein
VGDGVEPLTVACRFGRVQVERHVVAHRPAGHHVMPANAALPAHANILITRGLQEWACLLPQDLPFVTVARLLGWQTHEPQLLSASTVRTLVREHGQALRQAERAEVAALVDRDDVATLAPCLVPQTQPRRRPGWPTALNAAVDLALAAGEVRPPSGVRYADWDRVLTARRQEASVTLDELRHLGPELEPDQVLLTMDEVLTRQTAAHQFWTLRTARLTTALGTRYLSGRGDDLLRQVQILTPACRGPGASHALLLIGDGAHWIRTFFTDALAGAPEATMILDWWHLRKKCGELSSMICAGRTAKRAFLARLVRCLWRGEVDTALAHLRAYRRKARNVERLDALQAYLQERRAYLPDYRHRRCLRRYIGSGHSEKDNDLLVARRQKGKGMHWSAQMSDSLAALQTMRLNRNWDAYWCDHTVLPLVA